MKVAIYCRSSTATQDVAVQEGLCREYCESAGHVVHKVYADHHISGANGSRPAFNDLLRDMRRMRFNCVMVTKLDRLGRSLQHILALFTELTGRGVHFIAITQGIDTSSAAGQFQLQMLGAFAEFERNIISERTREGLRFAKNVGKRGPDKKPRKKREGFRRPIILIHSRD